MGWSEAGGGSQRAASGVNTGVPSDTLAFPGDVTAGSLLIVAGAAFALSEPTAVVVTDTRSTPYTTVLGATAGADNWVTFIAYGIAPSSGACTVTVAPSEGSNDFSYGIDEFFGPHSTPLSVNGGFTVNTSSTPADTITTLLDGELIIGVATDNEAPNATLNPNTTFTRFAHELNNTNNQCFSAVFYITTGASTYSVNWTVDAGITWGVQTLSFKPAAAVVAPWVDQRSYCPTMALQQRIGHRC